MTGVVMIHRSRLSSVGATRLGATTFTVRFSRYWSTRIAVKVLSHASSKALTGMRGLAAAYENTTLIFTDLVSRMLAFAFINAVSTAPALKGVMTSVASTSLQALTKPARVPFVAAQRVPSLNLETDLVLPFCACISTFAHYRSYERSVPGANL